MKKVDYTPRKKQDPILGRKYAINRVKLDPNFKSPLNNAEPVARQTQFVPSLATPGHSTAPKVTPECTLPNLIGISIVHKSCLQPIFSKEQAVDVASMRR
jgi:hypothetical protein